MRVVVTGAHGRLGRALIAALEEAAFVGPAGPLAWGRESFDLDAPERVPAVLDRDRPETVVHAAAWTDVDGCARQPELAMARNATATGTLAEACAARGLDLIVVSTNEVFDGGRTDGRGYAPTDPANPINAYGASKLAGERAALAAYGRDGQAAVTRGGGGTGDIAGALQFAAVHEKVVRAEVDAAPDPSVIAFAAELRARAALPMNRKPEGIIAEQPRQRSFERGREQMIKADFGHAR